MKATAKPITLYLDMKSMNSFHKPFGGGGGGGVGFGSKSSRIFFNSSSILSSFDMFYHKAVLLLFSRFKTYESMLD